MKMILAVVNNDDSNALMRALTKEGFQATKLASTGGFLMSGNTTFMIGVDEKRVDAVMDVIRRHSSKRKQLVPSSTSMSGVYSSFPVEVTVGGAIVFVLDVERFEKI